MLDDSEQNAAFLDSVPRLVNKADPSGATDAVQTTATNQPKALPLIDGEGYLFCSGVAGNSATIPHDSSLNLTDQLEVVARLKYRSYSGADAQCIVCKWASGDFNFRFHTAGYLQVYYKDSSSVTQNATSEYTIYNNNISDGETIWVKMTIDATSTSTDIDFYTSKDNVKNEDDVTWTALGTTRTITTNGGIASATNPVSFGAFDNSGAINDDLATGAVLKANYKAVIGGSPVLDIDFTSPRIPHGAREFTCETGQVVTVNTSGNDPATIIKKPVLRFDGSNDGLHGFFNQTFTGGYMFAAFSVLGNGGQDWGRVFSVNRTNTNDYQTTGNILSAQELNTGNLAYAVISGSVTTHLNLFDDANGDILHEVKITNSAQSSSVNGADFQSKTDTLYLDAQEFNIGDDEVGGYFENAAIDLEYLALFPASISDSQADQIRNFINNRNRVFSLIDSQGYFFFNGAATYDGQVFSGSGSWNGRIVGSDNGDADFYANENTTSENRPTTDGYKVTFADNSDKLDIPQVTLANGHTHAWMVCGTSLGTFSYKVTVSGETELNLLGHLGNASYRKAGDLYGIILLPQNATNRDIEEARRVLINRGAADGTTASNYFAAWYQRGDIVEFKNMDMSSITSIQSGWSQCSSLQSFSAQLPQAGRVDYAWNSCSSLSSFTTTDIKNCSNFASAWNGCSSLQSFPEDALLGTEATGVNFTSAWQNSGLTSFSTPLPTATTLSQAWWGCGSLTSFSSEFPLVTYAGYGWFNCVSLTSFSTPLPLSNRFVSAWKNCTSLTDFSADVFANWNPSSISSGVFNNAWDGCTSLTAKSVENILVPIANSGKWATDDGTSGGTALSDATIDIDYNVATGSLTAATLSAIETLNGRGWSVNINNQIIVPNILQLQPAAAYSLRSFDADADPTVVNVRRSSDGALSDFTASQVSDGTLTSWVGGSNLITYSNSFSTNWSKTSSSTLTGGQAGYDGTNDATEFYDSRSNFSYGMYQQILSLGIDGQITASIYLKAGTVSTGQLDVYYSGGNTVAVSFDLTAGTVEAGILGGSTNIPDAVGIDNVGNGWYRVSLTNDYGSPDIQYLRVGLSSAGTIFIQDAQVVYGDTVTPYVETNSSPAGNGYVTTFYDQSTNGRDSTQSTASSQPLIVENGVLLTDSSGNPAIVGDGVNDKLSHPTLTQSLDNSDFLVTAAFVDDLDMGIDGAIPRLYLQNNRMSYNNIAIITYTAQTGRKVMSFQVDGATQEVFSNGVSLGTASEAQVDIAQSMFNLQNSGADYSSGPLMEVVVFDANQSVQRTGIEKNINDHFNIY